MKDTTSEKQHVCIVNVGLYRSGTTTLAEAALQLGLKVYRRFSDLPPDKLKRVLQNPIEAVQEWSYEGGLEEVVKLSIGHDIICDGWIALLPFLSLQALQQLDQKAKDANVHLRFVATSRDVEATVMSELQHWIIHDLERTAGLSPEERTGLEDMLRKRALQHQRHVKNLSGLRINLLPLASNTYDTWSKKLSGVGDFSSDGWSGALKKVGVCNANPPLPVEGILLTMRLGTGKNAEDKVEAVEALLNQIEQDSLCRYLVVLGIDADERGTDAASKLINQLKSRVELKQQMQSFHIVTNPAEPPGKPFAICSAWDRMAVKGWNSGADWVVLLGDDVEIDCSYHYRAFYRSFQDITIQLDVPFGFGCPFWNDTSFPGFPSFPCVGKTHLKIFGGLIPDHRRANFVNQDLDPYLCHLYLKLGAAPCVTEAALSNGIGGNIGSGDARYERIPAEGWRDFVLDDFRDARGHDLMPKSTTVDLVLLDVIVPSYRVRLDYLQSICSLRGPKRIHTNFIVIVDNKDALLRSVREIHAQSSTSTNVDVTLAQAEVILEEYLSRSGNNVRVRCNEENLGASASRNRGLDESAAEFVLHLDDDLIPDEDLLEHYGNKLLEIDDSVVGLVGLVRFPRRLDLPLHHAAVLMSYLTFMFEIAERDLYVSPAWGVTANILFRRTSVRFDLAYAKTGGGEDVDYSLRVTKACNEGKLLALPEARVVHPFWPGSVFTLSRHFYSWAIGDGALFKRFPEHCYWSFPNLPEMLLLALPLCPWIGIWKYFQFILCSLIADFVVDASNPADYSHRCDVVQGIGSNRVVYKRSNLFYFFAHMLANLYVVGLECGRLRGHVGRLDLAYGIFRRFDWHVGRLANAPNNFRKKEAWKFGLFAANLVYLLIKS